MRPEKVGAQDPGTELLGPLGALSVGRRVRTCNPCGHQTPDSRCGGPEWDRLAPGVLWRNTCVPFQQFLVALRPMPGHVTRGSLSSLPPRPDAGVSPGQLPRKESPTSWPSVGTAPLALSHHPRMATFWTPS